MNKEIERKYLLPSFPHDQVKDGAIRITARKTIEQTYLALTESEEIRVRKLSRDGEEPSYTHTFKRGHGLSREEAEYTIEADIYRQLLEGTGRAPLIKTRTVVEDREGRVFEIDEYHQFHLLTVEAEFRSEEEARAFTPPAWFGPEVGSEEEYRNKQLWASVQRKP